MSTTLHWLYTQCIGPQSPLEISAERYAALALARKTLVDAVSFEQRYELMLGNYLAFESWAASCSLRAVAEFDHSYDAAIRTLSEANRHVMNLLSSVRSYVDQVKGDFDHLSLSPSFSEEAKASFSQAYDECKEYRFLEALRNFVQHHALPVHGISPSGRHQESGAWSESMAFNCLREYLEADGGFKKAVLAETDKVVELRYAIRQYLAALSRVHVCLRRLIAAEIDSARELFSCAIDDFRVANPDGATALAACRVKESGDPSDVIPIVMGWDDARLKLAEKNRFPLFVES